MSSPDRITSVLNTGRLQQRRRAVNSVYNCQVHIFRQMSHDSSTGGLMKPASGADARGAVQECDDMRRAQGGFGFKSVVRDTVGQPLLGYMCKYSNDCV